MGQEHDGGSYGGGGGDGVLSVLHAILCTLTCLVPLREFLVASRYDGLGYTVPARVSWASCVFATKYRFWPCLYVDVQVVSNRRRKVH